MLATSLACDLPLFLSCVWIGVGAGSGRSALFVALLGFFFRGGLDMWTHMFGSAVRAERLREVEFACRIGIYLGIY